jgi:chromosome segregation ATPase
MPSLGDFYDRLGQVNNHVADMDTELSSVDGHIQQTNTQLGTIDGTLTSIEGDVQQLNQSMTTLLSHVIEQNTTIICILEHISRNTCTLVNESAAEMRALQSLELSARELDSMTKTVHPEAALVLARDEAARLEIERCCPPKQHELPCHYEPCATPEKPDYNPSHVVARKRR